MALTGVTHLLTCLLGASWRGLAQGPLRVPPYMEHGWSISQASLWSLPRACASPPPESSTRCAASTAQSSRLLLAMIWFALTALLFARVEFCWLIFAPKRHLGARSLAKRPSGERPQRARLSEGILAAREALDGSY